MGAVVDARVKNRRLGNNQFGKDIPGSVWFHRHASGCQVLPATAVYDTGIQECVRVTLASGQSLDVSVGHEMWVDDNNGGRKIRASDVVVGDKIPLLSGEGGWGVDSFPELAELMGNLMGDGCVSKDVAIWKFFGDDIPYGRRLRDLAAPWMELRGDGVLAVVGPDAKYNVPRACFKGMTLRRIFVDEFGLSKKPRRVPRRVWAADKITVAGFLRGLFAADGHSEVNPTVVLAQNDRVFLGEIQLLLSNFGIRSSIYAHGEATDKDIVYADGRVFHTRRRPCWRLHIGGWDQAALFATEIGLGVPAKQAFLLRRLAATEGRCRHGAWRTSLVASIEPIGLKQTYCLTEPMTNTVTANGIVTGNCRCTPSTLLPGYGFDERGRVIFVTVGHSERDKQARE